MYANTASQVIGYEGPEAVNAAVSFSRIIGAKTITLIGVDLGTTDIKITRSESVLGKSDRIFDIGAQGNLTEKAYTCRSMENVKEVLGALVRSLTEDENINFFN